MKKLLIIILLLFSVSASAQSLETSWKKLLNLSNTWAEEQRFGHVIIDSSLSLYNLNGNRWFYANGEDSSVTFNGRAYFQYFEQMYEQLLYGSRLINTRTKLKGKYHDYTLTDSVRTDTINIVAFGNSILDGSSATTIDSSFIYRVKAGLQTMYPYAVIKFELDSLDMEANGGYSWSQYSALYESVSLSKPVDCLIIEEFSGDIAPYIEQAKQILSNIRKRSHCDILAIVANPDSTLSKGHEIEKETFRNLCNELNIEIADIDKIFRAKIAEGTPKSALYVDGSHPTDYGHRLYAEEILKHFEFNENTYYLPNTGYNIETYEAEQSVYGYDSTVFKLYGTWVKGSFAGMGKSSNKVIYNSTSTDSLRISLKGTIGFDLYCYSSVKMNFRITDASGKYLAPSDYLFNGQPMQGVSQAWWDDGNWSPNRDYRLFKVLIVGDTTECGIWTVEVTDKANDTVSIYSPTGILVGKGKMTTDITAGKIFIPVDYLDQVPNWKGRANYRDGDKFYFLVWNNYIDAHTAASTSAPVRLRFWGLPYGDYTLTGIKNNINTSYVDKIVVYKPYLK